MSRRRQSYRPYVGPSDRELQAIRYGRVLPDEGDGPLVLEGLIWWQLLAAVLAGVMLMPAVGLVVWVLATIAAALR